MTNRIEDLTWAVRHNGPGTTRYYEATDEATGTAFTAYQVGKSNWFLTGARDGETVIETADTTLKAVKFLAATFAASTAADEDAPAARPSLTWTSRKEWGSRGLTHRAKATVGGVSYRVMVESPETGRWTVRAWKDDVLAHYRVCRTQAEAQAEAETWFAEDTPATVEVVEDALVEVAAVKVGDEVRTATETLRGVSTALTEWARHAIRVCDKLSRMTTQYGCGCQSPVHRMSCGLGARPVVINRKDA